MPETAVEDKQPITIGSVQRSWPIIATLVGAVFTLFMGTVSFVWFASSMSSQVGEIKTTQAAQQTANDIRFTKIEAHDEKSDASFNEVQRKLDVLTEVSQRIDNKLGKP